MKNVDDLYPFYEEANRLVDLCNFNEAIKSIKGNIHALDNFDEISLAFLNCGFLSYKLRDYNSSIEYFSEAIYFENKLNFLDGRSKDISLNARSNSRYKIGDFERAIIDKRNARIIRSFELGNISYVENSMFIDYKNILLEKYSIESIKSKYNFLIKISKFEKSKYDLINDYKKLINIKRKNDLINKLELLSELKFERRDFKGSIKAIRRAEKFY